MVSLHVVVLTMAALAAGSGLVNAQPAPEAKPNVVLIITDDLGSADLSSYGARDIRTPHIDSLARDGVRLTQFYANAAWCTPTRAGLISGRYQQRYRLERPIGAEGTPTGEGGLPAKGHSLPQLLKDNGYATGLVGKWHLGYRPEHSPKAHGFDTFFGLKSGFIDYYAHTGEGGKPDLWDNDTPIQQEGYATDLITDRSVRFLDQHADRPFFLEVAYNAPHWPYQVPDHPSTARDNARHLLPQDSPTSTRADYVAMVERVDRGVGEILRAIDRLELAGRTIVIFTNDNGGEWLSSNAPFFHRKVSLWEGGIRVPALIRWPGHVPRGKVSHQVGITMDLHASILAATGTRAPASPRLDGLDLFPILEGRSPVVERTLFWRLNAPARQQRAVRSGDWKVVLDGTVVFVFDLRTDVGERHDLSGRRQDIANRLVPLVTAWEKDVDAEAKPEAKPGDKPVTVPSAAAGSGSWVAAWTAAPDSAGPPFERQSIRQIVRTTVGGSRVRIRLSNLFGAEPVRIGPVHVATHGRGSSIVPETTRPVTFNGAPTVTVAAGAAALSDPVAFPVIALQELAISFYLPARVVASTVHGIAMQTAFITRGDRAAEAVWPDADADADTDTSRFFLTDLEVEADGLARAVVIMGDSITDGVGSTRDANRRWSDALAERLQADPALASIAVVNSGIAGNRILNDGVAPFIGPSSLSRFDRDALDKPGVRWVIVLQGSNDISASDMLESPKDRVTAPQIIAGMQTLIARAHARGIRIWGATMLPRGGVQKPFVTTAAGTAARAMVNDWIRTSGAFDAVIDFERVMRDPERPDRLLPAFDSGDHLHPNNAGYRAMAAAIDLRRFTP